MGFLELFWLSCVTFPVKSQFYNVYAFTINSNELGDNNDIISHMNGGQKVQTVQR